jgi:hypothetical protein
MINKLLFAGALLVICFVLALIGSAIYDGLNPKPTPICARAIERLPPEFSKQAQEAWERMRPYAPECPQ